MISAWKGAIRKLAGSEISEIRPNACADTHMVKICALMDKIQRSFSTSTAVFRAFSLIFGIIFEISHRTAPEIGSEKNRIPAVAVTES